MEKDQFKFNKAATVCGYKRLLWQIPQVGGQPTFGYWIIMPPEKGFKERLKGMRPTVTIWAGCGRILQPHWVCPMDPQNRRAACTHVNTREPVPHTSKQTKVIISADFCLCTGGRQRGSYNHCHSDCN